jgi:acetate---CoA ligase (ADP-forming)
LVHTGAPPGRRLGAVTLSGAYRGLLLDSAERNGLAFHPLAGATTQRLNAVLTVGSLVGNPIDGGFGVLSSADNFMTSIDALQADPNVDMVLVQETLPRAPGSERTEHYIRLVDDYAATRATKPIAFITPISHGQNDYSRALRAKAPHVSFLQEAYKALRAIASVARRQERERLAQGAAADQQPPPPARRAIIERVRARAQAQAIALDEVESKNVLRAYGIATPAEALVTSSAAAVGAAERIGYPVVLKAVSAQLTHKSDVGAVALDLGTPAELTAAYDRMTRALQKQDLQKHGITGMLVCQQVGGGLELVLGLHRDPEMGLVVMAGSGGVLLELVKDVAFCAPPISRDKARDLLSRLRGARLLHGYRGAPAVDVEAVVDALVALGQLAMDLDELDLEHVVESVDINPFLALPRGGMALDALIVLKRHGRTDPSM